MTLAWRYNVFKISIQEQSEKKLAREKSALESTIKEKLDEFSRLNTDHDNLTKEFEQYKVRVHSVLKQQRQTSSDPAQLEQAKQGNLRFESVKN